MSYHRRPEDPFRNGTDRLMSSDQGKPQNTPGENREQNSCSISPAHRAVCNNVTRTSATSSSCPSSSPPTGQAATRPTRVSLQNKKKSRMQEPVHTRFSALALRSASTIPEWQRLSDTLWNRASYGVQAKSDSGGHSPASHSDRVPVLADIHQQLWRNTTLPVACILSV